MVARIIKGTAQVYFTKEHNGDRVLDLSDFPEIDSTIANEDIPVIGNWSDYSGQGIRNNQEVMLQGLANRKKTEAENIIGNEQTVNLTDRGISADIHRTRKKLVYVEA